MAVKIRLKRLGKIRTPHYRIVVMDSRQKRDGKAIEEIGQYHPKNDPSIIVVDSERAQYWLGVGAQPTEAVVALFKRSGDWQKFSGDTSPAGIDPQPERTDKTAAFNAALGGSAAAGDAVKTKAKKSAKTDEAKTDEAKADDAKTDEAKADDAKDYGENSFRGENPPEGFEIKGNEDSMKFHTPDSPWYGRTIAEVWFNSPEAAQAAGFVNAVADAGTES
ncbi:small subunit ribosomal protein S16 [Naumannella cuiyingiana]|uniref:Small ribosomal subunit protein bS16 n=1 Tax=Naumannella cuiyingiana TaxID=1347891 RepID=A0A7Z0DBN6_9ACTN|nr:small subunit ribosomal protein S16 [Naumannella cuiyingiana]